MSGRGGAGLAGGPRGRSAAGRRLPRGLHPARRDRADRLPEQNKAVVSHLLVRTAAKTLLTIAPTGQARGLKAHDPQPRGARIGATAVLDSWGSTLTHHPHGQMIVPGGGRSRDGTRGVRCKPGFRLPVRVLSRRVRRLFRAARAAAHAAGRRAFYGEIEDWRRRQAFDAPRAPRKRQTWFVSTKPPFAGPAAGRADLAR